MVTVASTEPLFGSPEPHLPLRRVKTTLLVASLKMLRTLGRFDDYKRALPPEYHGPILDAVAGNWIGVDVAVAHYRACEALGLSAEEQVEVGRTVGTQLRGTLAGTIVTMSKEVGVDVWTVLPVMPRYWGRIFEGGSLFGWKLGPKEIRLTTTGMALVDVRYFRNALRGQVMGMLDLFCSRTYANPLGTRFEPGTFSMRVQWA
jgi:hypothetical protein